VSFLGLAYFLALLVGWMVADRGVPAPARWLLRIGGAASLVFVGVMLAYRKFCPYCVGTHTANLAVLAMVEWEIRRTAARAPAAGALMPWSRARRIAGAAAGAFVTVSLVLGIANARFQRQVSASAESERRASTERILAQTRAADASRAADADRPVETSRSAAANRPAGEGRPADANHAADENRPVETSVPADENRAAEANRSADAGRSTDASRTADTRGVTGFTGRYRFGPEASPIRVVMLTDYQCVDCRRIEGEIEGILATRKDVSVSIKHYPFCAEAVPGVPCNRNLKQTMHPNACWAARAAEAAGILRGNDGFWEMHRWLFARGGAFTDADLMTGLAQLGFAPEPFLAALKGPETLRRVQADCDEGTVLGLYFTPMIFVNGVEFKGWQVPGALRRTIEEVAATHPPALTAAADRPVLAGQKDIDDWRAQPVRVLPADTRAWSMGAPPASSGAAGSRFVDVVLFGDYQEPYTASMDRAIRDFMKGRSGIRYTFRHYPIDPSSNPTLPAQVRREAIHPLAGRAAKAAEAAGSIGGSAAYWKMHAWLMEHVESFNDGTLRSAAEKLGIDPTRLLAEMEKPEVTAAIIEDARAAQQIGLTAVPMVFVNGRWVQRTIREGVIVVVPIMEEAGRP
jgi:protein-disulfide isomerase